MKKLLATCIALSLGLAASLASAGVVVTFSPSTQHADVGDTVHVEMRISGLGAEVLSAFDLNFFYNPAVVQYLAVDSQGADNALGTFSGLAPLIALDPADGNLDIQGYALVDDATLAAGQADAFTLFSFDLLALADGTTSFTLGSDLTFERNFVGLDFLTLPDVTVQGACIAVGTGSCRTTDLPEPGTAALALAALALGLPRRRRPAQTA